MSPHRPRARRALRVAAGVAVLATALAVVGATGPAVAQDQRPRVELPASIDATGGRDVTAELDAFFAEVPNGTIVDFPRGGRFRAEGTVDIVDKVGITVRGNASTIFAKSQGDLKRIHVQVIRGGNIRIERLYVEGAHPSGGIGDDGYQAEFEGQHGFAIKGTDGIELDSVAVSDVYGDFVYLGKPDDSGQWARRVWIHDSLFVRNGRQGLAVVAAEGVVFERNGIAQVARSTIDLEPNTESGGAIDIQILNNQVGPGRLLFLAAAGNGPVASVVVSGNQLTGRALTATILPPEGTRRDRFWIVGNRGGAPAKSTPIKAYRIDGLMVWRNLQPVTRGAAGVLAEGSCGVTVAENDFGAFVPPVEVPPDGCGRQLGPVPPDPPEVFGRVTGPEPEPQLPATTTTTTAPGPPPITTTDGARQNWAITITLGVIAAAMVIAAAVLRSRRQDPPPRPPRSHDGAGPDERPPPPDLPPPPGPPSAPSPPVDVGAR